MEENILKKIKKQYSTASLAIILQILISSVVVVFAGVGFALIFPDREVSYYVMVFNSIGYLVADFLAAVICVNISKVGKIRNWFKKPKINVLGIIAACFITSGVGNAVVYLLTLTGNVYVNTTKRLGESLEAGILSDSRFVMICSIIYTAVLGPIVEEILCRGAILNISSVVSRRFAFVASSVLFGLMQGNFIQFINATIMGFVLAYFAEKTQSLIVPIIMHIFNNIASILTEYFPVFFGEDKADAANYYFVIGLIVVGVICAIFMFSQMGKLTQEDGMEINRIVSDEEIASLKASKTKLTAGLFFTRFTFIVVLIYGIGMSIYAAMPVQ